MNLSMKDLLQQADQIHQIILETVCSVDPYMVGGDPIFYEDEVDFIFPKISKDSPIDFNLMIIQRAFRGDIDQEKALLIAVMIHDALVDYEWEEKTLTTNTELAEIREQLGLSKAEFAEKLGITNMLLGRYEKGSCKVPDKIIDAAKDLMAKETIESEESQTIEDVMAAPENVAIPNEEESVVSLIKSLRNNFTLTALGDLLGVSRTTVSNYESGKRVPGPDIIEKIRELMEKTVTPDDEKIEAAPADEKIDATSVADDEKIEAAPVDEKEAAPVVDDEKIEEDVEETASPSISDLISLLRKTYTLSALGKLLGVSGTAVSNYESGKNTPKEKIIKKIEELVEETKATTSVDEEKAVPAEKEEAAPVDEEKAAPVDEEKTSPADEEKTTPADEEKTAPKNVEIFIQSLMGGSITTEEILSRLPEGVETVYIKPEENAAYWVRGAESGSIYLW